MAYLGSQSELARRSGVSQSTIATYIIGRSKNIRDDVWDKLEPHLRRFMPSEVARSAPNPESSLERDAPATLAPAPATPATPPALSAKEQVMLEAFRELGSEEQKSVLSCLLSGKPVCANSRPSPCPRPYDSPVPPGDSETSGGASAA